MTKKNRSIFSRKVFDKLGDKVKSAEIEMRNKISPLSYALIRLDGRSFHNFTKGFQRPYDTTLMSAMDATALKLCEEIPGVHAGYVQSDEITLLMTDYKYSTSTEVFKKQQFWFGGEQQKIVSVSASLASAVFNQYLNQNYFADNTDVHELATFDSRIFAFNAENEQGRKDALDVFTWRHMDAMKNSVSMSAHHQFGTKALHGVNLARKLEMLSAQETPWGNLPDGFKYGRVITREPTTRKVSFVDKRDGQTKETVVESSPYVAKDAVPFVFDLVLNDAVPAHVPTEQIINP